MNKKFWKAAGIRALRTFCQVLATAIPTNAILLSDVKWGVVLSTATLAGIVSIIMSVATGLPESGEPEEGGEDE